MSGLYSTLNSSVKAISAHSRAIETTGKNLANVNNTTYARQRVIYGDKGTVVTPQGAESLGLEALGIQQLRDHLLDMQVAREISLAAQYKAEQSGYQRAQAGLGQSVDRTNTSTSTGVTDNGLGAAIDNFFNSFQSLAANPTDSGQRVTLLQNAEILTGRFQLADQRLAQVQSDLNAQINNDVGSVNTLLTTIADLNAQITRFEVNNPGSAVDLRDQRQARIEELAAKMPVSVVDSGGTVQLLAKDSGGANVVIVNGGAVQGSIAFNGTSITGGASGVALALSGGSIKGSLIARDIGVQTLRDNLDALARQLVTSVNAEYIASGSNFFNPIPAAPPPNPAKAISVAGLDANSLRAGVGAAGDNSIAVAVARLATPTVPFSTGSGDYIDGTFSGFLAKTVSGIGQALAGANAKADDQANIEKLVRGQRDAVSGVSLDEELADLMKYQRAFQASSRVFTVVDELLETIVNRLGA